MVLFPLKGIVVLSTEGSETPTSTNLRINTFLWKDGLKLKKPYRRDFLTGLPNTNPNPNKVTKGLCRALTFLAGHL